MRGLRVLALLLCVLLSGCTLFEQLQPSEPAVASSSQTQRPKITVSGSTSSRGADLDPVSGEGQLIDPDASSTPDTAGEPVEKIPLRWDLRLLAYRAMLSEPEQLVYDEIYSQLMQMNNFFVLRNLASLEQIDNIIHAVLYDNPELFWVDSRYRYSYTEDGRVNDVTVTFNTLSSNIDEARRKFEQAADALVLGARALPSDVEKAKFVHDSLVAEVDYQLGAPQNQSAYSALVTKRSVCAGYSRAFQYVMMQLDIPCYYCVGYAGEDHAWNIIQLGGDYYNVDLSWDDPLGSKPGEVHYEYYNITDEKIFYDHRREELSVNLPPCNATQYSYNETYGTEAPVREGGEPQSYLDLGYTSEQIVTSLDSYYALSKQALLEQGMGETTSTMVLQSDALRAQVYDVVSNRKWFAEIVTPAARELQMSGYSAEIGITYEPLQNGYVLLTQKITVTEK